MKKSKSKAVRAIEEKLDEARKREEVALGNWNKELSEIKGLQIALEAARKALERAPKGKTSKAREQVVKQFNETARAAASKTDGSVPIQVNQTTTDGA